MIIEARLYYYCTMRLRQIRHTRSATQTRLGNTETLIIAKPSNLKQRSADQADTRRSQLIDIAAKLIDQHGVEAAKFSTIAELAGCTRSLVYHYFPKTTDLHTAIAENFYGKLSAMINEADQKQAVIDRYDGPGGTTNALFSAVFDLFKTQQRIGFANFHTGLRPLDDKLSVR